MTCFFNQTEIISVLKKETSAVFMDGRYLPPRATILLWLLKQAVVFHEAIFTRFPAAWSATTNVSVEKLVRGAFCHLRPPTESHRTQSSPTCVTIVAQSHTRWKWKRIKRPLCAGSAGSSRPSTVSFTNGVELQQRSFIRKHIVRSLTQKISTRRWNLEIRLLKHSFKSHKRLSCVGGETFIYCFVLSNSVVGLIGFLVFTLIILAINATSENRKIQGRIQAFLCTLKLPHSTIW